MKAIVVTDQAAGTAGMTLVERPEPQAAINDVVVQVHASGFTWDELTWPSTWTDRLGRDRTPVIPGQVVHDQDTDAHDAASAVRLVRGRRIVNSVNSPTRLSTSIVPPCCWVTMS